MLLPKLSPEHRRLHIADLKRMLADAERDMLRRQLAPPYNVVGTPIA